MPYLDAPSRTPRWAIRLLLGIWVAVLLPGPVSAQEQSAWTVEGDLQDATSGALRAVRVHVDGDVIQISIAAPYDGAATKLFLDAPEGLGDSNGTLQLRLRASANATVVLSERNVTFGTGPAGAAEWNGTPAYEAELPVHLAAASVRPLEILVDGVMRGTWWIPTGVTADGPLWFARYLPPDQDGRDVETKPGYAYHGELTRADGSPSVEGDLVVFYHGERSGAIERLDVYWSNGTGRADGSESYVLGGWTFERLASTTWPLDANAQRVMVRLHLDNGDVITGVGTFEDPGRPGAWNDYPGPTPSVGFIAGALPVAIGLLVGIGVAVWVLRSRTR